MTTECHPKMVLLSIDLFALFSEVVIPVAAQTTNIIHHCFFS
jgi:hypothetical protein